MNVKDVEVGKVYYCDDDFEPITDEDLLGEEVEGELNCIYIVSKDATRLWYDLSYENDSAGNPDFKYAIRYIIPFKDCLFECFLTPLEALTSYVSKLRQKVRVCNVRELKEDLELHLSPAEECLDVLKKKEELRTVYLQEKR